MKFIIFLGSCFFLWIFIGNLRSHKSNRFDMYIGVPGSGKTTFAAYLAKKRFKKGKKNKKFGVVLSNVPIKGSYKVVKSDIGTYMIKDCLLIMDEAGIDYNNRNFKSFSHDETYFYKFHRHYNVDIAMFSQDFDIDLKLRKLATRIFIVNKSIFPGFVKRKQVSKKIGIDSISKQLIDQYQFVIFGTKYIYCPKLWKLFDSYSYKELPSKEFQKY
ncbi:MAG: zonular occludens toxin domain-containing protein [bacterium]|nr:zonular occludens toxin domain-containing protein [bacterium]